MGKVIYKNLHKSDSLDDYIKGLLKTYQLEDTHVTLEKVNKIYSMRVSLGRYVVSKKDFDAYNLADKVIFSLDKQIKSYENKQVTMQRRSKIESTPKQNLVKIKKFIIKPTNQENALEHMVALGHKFYIYIDEQNNPVLLFESEDEEIYAQQVFELMSIDNAFDQLFEDVNLHYVAFKNQDNEDMVTVVYRRKSGDFGIIDADCM